MSNDASPTILVSIATYNEVENLPRLVPAILQVVPTATILVIDDNSPDGTGKWCDEFATADNRLVCIHRTGKLGLGSAAIAGINYAIEHDFDLLVNLDADFSHPPAVIPDLVEKLNETGTDVAIGSRYMPGGSIEGWPWRRKISSRIVNWMARKGLGLDVSDCSGSFRCYSVTALKRMDASKLTADGYSFYEEVLLRLARSGATFCEVPFTFVEREQGVTKLGYAEAIQAGTHLLKMSIAALSPFAPRK